MACRTHDGMVRGEAVRDWRLLVGTLKGVCARYVGGVGPMIHEPCLRRGCRVGAACWMCMWCVGIQHVREEVVGMVAR